MRAMPLPVTSHPILSHRFTQPRALIRFFPNPAVLYVSRSRYILSVSSIKRPSALLPADQVDVSQSPASLSR